MNLKKLIGSGAAIVAIATFTHTADAQTYTFSRNIGNGSGSGDGQFQFPGGLTLDSGGNLYVADYFNNHIEKFNSAGVFVQNIGSGGSGTGHLHYPTGVVVDGSGNIYVTDSATFVKEFSSSGTYITGISTGLPPSPPINLSALARDSSGNFYVAAFYSVPQITGRIIEIDSNGTFVRNIGAGILSEPTGIAFDSSGDTFISDANNNNIAEFNSNGTLIKSIGSKGSGNGQFTVPGDIRLDSNGNIYTADVDNSRIVEFDSSGNFVQNIGSYGTGNGQMKNPAGLTFDTAGNLYVSDTNNTRIVEFTLAAVPEPGSLALLVGMVTVGASVLLRKRRK